MRVQVRHMDSGATALILVFMTLIFLGFAAIAVDAGYGFVNKRNMQNAADSAALAGADSLVNDRRTCSAVAGDAGTVASVRATARGFSTGNRAENASTSQPENLETGFEVRCSSDNRRIEVWYRNGGATTSIFAPMIGAGNATAAEREAVASVGVPGAVTGLRPYFLCINDANALRSSPNVMRIEFPNNLCQSQPGNWYPSDCPEDGESNNGTVISNNTTKGCESEISIVDLTSANGDPAIERQLLLAACQGSPTLSAERGCLTGNTGNDFAPLSDEWTGLLGQIIALPVFDLDTVVGNGNNARYPIRAILGAKVCGFKFGNAPAQRRASGDPDCGTITFPGGNNRYIWIKFDTYQTTGTSKPSTCPVGDPECDYGLRNVSLDQ